MFMYILKYTFQPQKTVLSDPFLKLKIFDNICKVGIAVVRSIYAKSTVAEVETERLEKSGKRVADIETVEIWEEMQI